MGVPVLIDVDGTLIRMRSSERSFFPVLVRSGLFGSRQAWGYIAFLFRYGATFRGSVWKKNKGYLTGLPVERVRVAARDFVATCVVQTIRPSMQARIARHLEAGDEVCLLTGTPDFIAEPLASAVAVAHVIATICATEAGRFVTAPPVQHPYAEEKRRLAYEWARRNGFDLRDATAYGNSVADRYLLEVVGTPVAVAPDRRLREIAGRADWKIVDD